jgi:hypothetical protein
MIFKLDDDGLTEEIENINHLRQTLGQMIPPPNLHRFSLYDHLLTEACTLTGKDMQFSPMVIAEYSS